MMEQRKILGDALSLSGRRVWNALLSLVAGCVVARLLGPAGYGWLAALMLIPTLATYGSLGWRDAALRESAHLSGAGQVAVAQRLRVTAYRGELALGLCWVAIAVAVAVQISSWPTRVAILIGAVWMLVNKCMSLLQLDVFLEKAFTFQAKVGAAVETVGAVGRVMGAWLLGPIGTFISLFLADVLGLVLYWRRKPLHLTGRIEFAQLWRLTKIGVPMAALTFVSGASGLMVYLDRAILGGQGSLELLGLYVFATNLGRYLVTLMGDWVMAYQPHLLEALATSADRNEVFALLWKPSLAITYASAIGASCLLVILPPLITVALPQYVPVIPLLPVFFLAVLVTCVYYLPGVMLCSAFANQQIYYLKVWIVAVALFGGMLLVVTRLGLGLAGAAWATVVASVSVAVPTVLKAFSYSISDWRQGFSYAWQLLLPLGYVLLVHVVLGAWAVPGPQGLTGSWLADRLPMAVLVLLVSCVPLAIIANRLFGLRRLLLVSPHTSL